MTTENSSDATVAVVVPCYNEALTIGKVVADFRAALPEADVYVFDNNSTDGTAGVAAEAGATVVPAIRPGKGSVVRKMFSEVEADVYVMVDGDDTYESGKARDMVDLLLAQRLDMVVGTRQPAAVDGDEFPAGHALGNKAFSGLFRLIFRSDEADAFSGYRVMSRRFVKSFPARTSGFDTETELVAHAAELRLEVAEVPVEYYARPEGSESKLGTYRDGAKILWSAMRLFRDLRPKAFFGLLFALLTTVAVLLMVPVVIEYLDTGLVARFPTAILAASIEVVAVLLLASGLVISSVRQVSREQRRLAYLAVEPVRGRTARP